MNFNILKSLAIKNETEKKVHTIKLELEKRLEAAVNQEKVAVNQVSTGFSWIALFILIILFLIVSLSD
jgi:hypothetical protein